jgi:phage shock protein PspC (stress-responsive transcriptional regulator)
VKLYRSQTDKRIAGVCGGIAQNIGWSAGRLRVVWVLATLLTAFTGVILYLGLWYLMPEEPPRYEEPLMQPWKVILPSGKK